MTEETPAYTTDTAAPAPGADSSTTADATPQVTAPESTAETPTFYDDPNELPEELKPAYKRLLAAYTKKTQSLAEQKRKIEAYDAFTANPMASLQAIAQQYGLTLQQAQQVQQAAEQSEWLPNNWTDVISRAKQEAMSEFQRQMMPLLGELTQLKKTHLESQLDSAYPEWREYEDDMVATVRQHPSLANDPVKLLKLALPDEVLEKKAMKAALLKLQGKADAAKMGHGSRTGKMPSEGPPSGPMSFSDAVSWAKRELERRGIRRS